MAGIKASIYLWIVSIIMPAIYINVYYRAGLYADFGINIYFLLASLYGWIVWKWGKKKQKETSDKDSETSGIRHFDRSTLPAVAGVFLVLFLLIGWILIQFTDSTVPWLDSFTTAASIIAKVIRDRIMAYYDRLYPEYHLLKHKGYPTKEHLELLQKHGLKPIYRLSYGPCQKILGKDKNSGNN